MVRTCKTMIWNVRMRITLRMSATIPWLLPVVVALMFSLHARQSPVRDAESHQTSK
jgi:hypothetical protein